MECHLKRNVIKKMSFKIEYYLKFKFTQNGMSLKMEYNSKWNVTKMEFHYYWNVIWIGPSLKLKWHPNWNVTQIGISLKFECQSNWKTKLIEMVVIPKQSDSASIGRISILFAYQTLPDLFYKKRRFNFYVI